MNKLLLVAMLLLPSFSMAKKDAIERTGDVLNVGIPLFGLAMTYLEDDPEARGMWFKSYLSTGLTTHALKFLVDKDRPDGSANNSFPSGHTSSAMSGAAFIHTRYGKEWGIPAFAAASFVGWSRVHSEKHYWEDVLAGTGIALAFNAYWVKEPEKTDVVLGFNDEQVFLGFSHRF